LGKDAVIVVFGCRHEREYSGRIEEALIRASQKRVDPMFIFTGNGPIPPNANRISVIFGNNRIILENRSTTTLENIKHTFDLIKKRKLDWFDIYIVSSWYHIPRIKLFLKQEGIKIPKQNFIKSYTNIQFINVLIEPFAYIAAYLGINHWSIIKLLKRGLGYNV
jgi:uncharacterized SAM-binding protein YcdF (DUF218 family)